MSAESSKENLGAISVKLLKRLLDAKKVSYDDCLEKTQLIQRVLDSGALATDVDLDALKVCILYSLKQETRTVNVETSRWMEENGKLSPNSRFSSHLLPFQLSRIL